MINAKGVSQIIVYVADMAQQVAFYRDLLGLAVAYPHVADYAAESWVAFSTGECTFALHGGGGGSGSAEAPRFNFEVDDIQSARDTLIAQNVWVGEIRSPIPNVYVLESKDPEGNYFTLRQS